jgi:hypothetical protein
LAKLAFPIHPHMLRHGCGFKLANDGVDTRALQHFLGHRNITHTVRYTELRSDRFDGFWKRLSKDRERSVRWQRAAQLLLAKADVGAVSRQLELALLYDGKLDVRA